MQDKLDWNTALNANLGIKLHTPTYAIVVHRVPAVQLNEKTTRDTIDQVEQGNNMPLNAITKITNLLRRNKQHQDTPDKVPQSHSIVLYFNDRQQANYCIKNGIYIDYTRYVGERFCPQSQIMQCYNCHSYSHTAANCQQHTRCGRCGDKHSAEKCKATKPLCLHCGGDHEARHHQC
jgi:hypothetical protein